MRFLEDARQLQDTQDVCMTDIIVRHPRICLTKAARLPQDNGVLYCKAAIRMLRNVRLQLRIAQWPHDCRTGTVPRIAFLATVLQILQDYLAASLHVTRDNLTNIVRMSYVLCDSVRNCLRSASPSLCSVARGKIARTNGTND